MYSVPFSRWVDLLNQLAGASVAIISGSIEVTVDYLTELDRLVQLLETPIFTCE